jgi:hypothetical protein
MWSALPSLTEVTLNDLLLQSSSTRRVLELTVLLLTLSSHVFTCSRKAATHVVCYVLKGPLVQNGYSMKPVLHPS